MTETPQKHPLVAYFEAKGFMRRKPYIFTILGLIVFTFLTLLFAGQQLTEAGVDPQNAVLPLWAAFTLFLAKALALPAVIMRTRDTGLPISVLAGTYAAALVLELVQIITSGLLPNAIVGAVNLMAMVVVLALMFRPSSTKA